MPPSTMLHSSPASEESSMAKLNQSVSEELMTEPEPFSLRITQTTKERIRKKSELGGRKSEMDGKDREARKLMLAESLGKWSSPLDASSGPNKAVKKKKSKVMAVKGGGASDELSKSEHSRPRMTRSHSDLSKSDHGGGVSFVKKVGKKKQPLPDAIVEEELPADEERISKPGDQAGNLGNMLNSMNNKAKPVKHKSVSGSRSVASMPARKSTTTSNSSYDDRSVVTDVSAPASGSPRCVRTGRKKSSTERSQSSIVRSQSPCPGSPVSPHRSGARSQSPGALRKHSAVKDRVEDRARSASPGALKKRTSSLRKRSKSPHGLKKKRESMKGGGEGSTRQRRKSNELSSDIPDIPEERTSKPGDNLGKLGNMLDSMSSQKQLTKKKGTSRSVASAPVVVSEQLPASPRQKRRGSKGPKDANLRRSSRRAKSVDVGDDDSSVSEVMPSTKKDVPRRTKSADNDHPAGEANYDWAAGRPSQKFSKRLSRADKSFRGKNVQSPKKASKVESDTTTSTHQGDSSSIEGEQSGGGDRRSMMAKSKRSNGAAPKKANNAEEKKDTLSNMKRFNSMQPKPTEDDQGSQDAPHRAQSMMLHRENARRGGKSNSLANLQEYSEDEIHSTSYFASNHVLVNRERMKRGLRPLTRNIQMDELARKNSQSMADSAGSAPIQATYVGNVLRGESIRAIHRSTMQQRQGRERANLLNPYFQDFGVGTAKGEDGMLYICQLFSERIQLTCADTES